MPLDFPNSPVNGVTTYTDNNVTWLYTGGIWVKQNSNSVGLGLGDNKIPFSNDNILVTNSELLYDPDTFTLILKAASSGQGDFLKIQTNGGSDILTIDNKYRISAGSKVFYGTSAPTGTQAPTNSADSTATGLLWFDSTNGVLKAWTDYGSPGTYSWQAGVVGSYLTLNTAQTITGAKTFNDANLLLQGTALIGGSGVSKVIYIRPTNGSSTLVDLIEINASTGFKVKNQSAGQDFIVNTTGDVTCRNLTITGSVTGIGNVVLTSTNQTITGKKTFSDDVGIGAKGIIAEPTASGTLRLGTNTSGGVINDGFAIAPSLITALTAMQIGSGSGNKNLTVYGNVNLLGGGQFQQNGSAFSGVSVNGVGWIALMSYANGIFTSSSNAWSVVSPGGGGSYLRPSSGTWSVLAIKPNINFDAELDMKAWNFNNFSVYTGITNTSNDLSLGGIDLETSCLIAIRTA